MASIVQEGNGWRVFIRRKGFKSASKVFSRKVDAQRWAREQEQKMDAGVYVDTSKVTFRTIMERFRDEVCPHREGGRWEEVRINAFLRQDFMKFIDKAAATVTAADIDRWIGERKKTVKDGTILRELNLLSGIVGHAKNVWRYSIPKNPLTDANRPKEPKHRTRRPTPKELETLAGLLRTYSKPSLKWYACCMFMFAVETGLRLAEITRLHAGNVFLDKHYLTVDKSKNGDARNVPLSDKAIELMRAAQTEAGFFPVNVGSLGGMWRRLCKDHGFSDLHFHDSRHEACTRLSKVYTVLELAKIIGHRDLQSLMVYYNPTPEELAAKLRGAS